MGRGSQTSGFAACTESGQRNDGIPTAREPLLTPPDPRTRGLGWESFYSPLAVAVGLLPRFPSSLRALTDPSFPQAGGGSSLRNQRPAEDGRRLQVPSDQRHPQQLHQTQPRYRTPVGHWAVLTSCFLSLLQSVKMHPVALSRSSPKT